MNKIGAHVSAAGGVHNAPQNAYDEGCECFQFFSRPPQGGPAPQLTPEIIKEFKSTCKKYKLDSYIHTPYYISLAHKENRIKYGSIKTLRQELERGSQLGCKYIMTHLGTAKGHASRATAINEVTKSLTKTLDGYQGSCMFLMENSAGSGEIIGGDFKELKKILNSLKKFKVGICLDVMHAFAVGYKTETVLDKFDKQIGLKYLKLIHANDAKVELASGRDRHEHIGKGKIGAENFKKLLLDKRLKNVNFILETPADGRNQDIKILKKLRSNK